MSDRTLVDTICDALALIDDLRAYASTWDWKYGAEWDREKAAIVADLERYKETDKPLQEEDLP